MTATATTANVLLVARAPVAGQAKTRLAATLGDVAAAELAAAALLDTLRAVEDVTSADQRLVAITGDLSAAQCAEEIASHLQKWQVVEQRGHSFGRRLVSAHRDATTLWGPHAVVVQIGMDTPQVTGADLTAMGSQVADEPPGAVTALGPAADGGWWALATSARAHIDVLTDVPMSRSDTCRLTVDAFEATGTRVELLHVLRDVDTIDDAAAVAAAFPQLIFSGQFSELFDGRHQAVTGVVS